MDDEDEELNQQHPMHVEDIHQIQTYLSLPIGPELSSPPLAFLSTHINALPPPLLRLFSSVTTPRQRTSIRQFKSRRLVYASQTPLPPPLTASLGRLRWPLLWERMGGSSLPPPSINVAEEEKWVKEHFLPDKEGRQHVKKLGGFLRGLEEEREMEEIRMAKRQERKLDQVGEEFDEESDEEEDEEDEERRVGDIQSENQDEVKLAFERKLLEIFLDGLDTISYDEIDFTEPDEIDPIAVRDAEDQYFDEEEPSEDLTTVVTETQNGTGEYDY